MLVNCASGNFAMLALDLMALLLADVKADAQPATDYTALLAAPNRSEEDRQADKRRDPLPFLAFADLRPGMKVLDMGAGRGYSTELIARAVAPSGIVYGQNPPDLPDKPKATFEARLKTPARRTSWLTFGLSTTQYPREYMISTWSRSSSFIMTQPT
jgi:predicted methyltransferase